LSENPGLSETVWKQLGNVSRVIIIVAVYVVEEITQPFSLIYADKLAVSHDGVDNRITYPIRIASLKPFL